MNQLDNVRKRSIMGCRTIIANHTSKGVIRPMRDILIIGSLNMDTVVCASHIPVTGETIIGSFVDNIPGGKGANQACAAGKLGSSAAMLGLVGNDEFGDALIGSLRQSNVDTSLVGRSEARTGQALICVNDQGNNAIIVLPGANGECGIDRIRAHKKEIADSRYLMLQLEIPEDAVMEAIRMGKEHGCGIILNPAPAQHPLPPEILPLIDYLTPNETELSILTGLPANDPDEAAAAAKTLITAGVKAVLATLGSRGALYVTADTVQLFPAEKVKPVDTTAAGDTFNAAFAVRLAEGAAVSEAIRFANAAAGISVTRHGAQPSIPGREEIDRFLATGSIA